MPRKEKTPRKRELIRELIKEYGVDDLGDIQEALKDLLGGTIEEMLQEEIKGHLGYEKYKREEKDNYRKGYKAKKLQSNYGEIEIEVPQDRNSTYEPKIVPKRQKDISEIEGKIIGLYV